MASMVDNFNIWLIDKLKSLNTDENVFGSYISGILDGDESKEEKEEALESILSDITDIDINKHVQEIMEKWKCYQPTEVVSTATTSSNVEEQLVKLLGSQTLATAAPKQYTEEELKVRKAILQYSQLSDDEECENTVVEGEADLVRNTNAANVVAAAKERREQAKLESQKKKEKDKEDREKQKQLREEKKEKRKTLKNERKR